MKRFGTCTLLVLLAILVVEPVFANKFTTIGGGVGGVSREKIAGLQMISLGAGIFFSFLGFVALLGRRRFEGLVVTYTGKPFEIATSGPIFLVVFGGILAGLYFL